MINYGWRIWFALVAIGALIGIPVGLASPAGKVLPGMALGALALGVLGILPSIMIAIKYGDKTDLRHLLVGMMVVRYSKTRNTSKFLMR